MDVLEASSRRGRRRMGNRPGLRLDWDRRPEPTRPDRALANRMNSPLRLPDLPFRKITLANGLDVIALKTGLLPIVAVNLWYHVGSKNEERTQRGFAHLFEHLMFEGSEHYPGDYFKPLQRLGASVNGSTSPDRTNYFVDLPSAHAELAVAMESDRMANFLPALSDEKIRVQKDVVKNEYRQNYANRPYGQVWKILAEAMYGPDHPYSWLTIGAMEDVERASRDDIEAFFRRYYVPSNASLALVGDIDEDRAFALAERYFGPIPPGAKAQPLWWAERSRRPTPQRDHDPRARRAGSASTWSGRRVRQFDPRRRARLTLLADILARGRSSRLYRGLVMERADRPGRDGLPVGPRDRRQLRRDRDPAARDRRPRRPAIGSPRSSARSWSIGRDGRGAGSRQERPARRLRLRARQRRRVRRRGRSAQRLQHLPRRPGPDHDRLPPLPRRDGRGRSRPRRRSFFRRRSVATARSP